MKNKIGYIDTPIKSIEEDSFIIGNYINGLCEFIKSCETPMTISIQGDWGSGKTSMMNMMQEQLKNDVHSIWFNTWQYSQFNMGDELAVSFLSNLISKLEISESNRTKVLISGLARLGAKLAVSTIGADSTIIDQYGNNTKDLSNIMEDLQSEFNKCVKEKLDKVKKQRIVVFIDDLDRLNPIKAIELLEVLKVFLDCENCVFILAVDYNVVTMGIKQKFGDMVSDEKGKSFFDKIIQLPFKMPVAEYDIRIYLKKMLEKMGTIIDDENIKDYVRLVKLSIGFNPRSMKRLLNTYQLINLISKSQEDNIEKLVKEKILFATICMQMVFDELYSVVVKKNKEKEIVSDFLFSLTDTDLIQADPDLIEDLNLLDADKQINTIKLEKIAAFMKAFLNLIDLDKNQNLSETELEVLQTILKFTSVTSVNSESVEIDPEDKSRRYENKNIVIEINKKLIKNIGEFRVWQPRKARYDIKLSDVGSRIQLTTKEGYSIEFEYYISPINIEKIQLIIRIGIWSNRDLMTKWGDNPLHLENKPSIDKWWIQYNMGVLENTNEFLEDQILEKVQDFYSKMKEYNII